MDMEKDFPAYCKMITWSITNSMRQARLNAGITQQEMADLIHVNRSYISNLENNKCDVPFSIIVKYSVILHVPLSSFFDMIIYNAPVVSGRRAEGEFEKLSKRSKAYIYALMRELNKDPDTKGRSRDK